jgi:hypothetical protein
MLPMKMASHIDRWPLDKFILYARNARTHSDEQVAQIAASIKEFGFVNPILAGPDRVLIAGHARLMAARNLGLTEAPVIVVEGLKSRQPDQIPQILTAVNPIRTALLESNRSPVWDARPVWDAMT